MRKVTKPSKHARNRRIRLALFWAIILIGFSSYVYIFSKISYSSFFEINTITFEGLETIPQAQIENLIFADINSSSTLISKKFIFTASTHFLEKDAMKNFPVIEEISISRNFFHTLHVYIHEYQPIALWCDGEFEYFDPKETPCYEVSSSGFIFAKADSISTSTLTYFGVLKDASSSDSIIGNSITDQNRFADITSFISSLNQDTQVVAMAIHANHEYETYIKPENASSTTTLYSNETQPLARTALIFSQFIKNQNSSIQPSDFLKTLSYVDLRYGTNVYFTLK